MSTAPHPANSDSSFCETAEVRVASRWPWPQSDYKLAYVLVSSRIYWKVANEDGSNKPQSFIDFRNENSLELVRLDDEKTWNDVDNDVKMDDERRITVSGRLHGRSRRNNGLLVRNVQLEIKHTAPEQVRVWISQIRARIVPWNLVEQEIKDVARGARSSGVKELEQVLGALVGSGGGTQPSSTSTGEAEGMWSKLPENMAKLSIVDKLTSQATGAVGSGATLAAFATKVECVAETAALIGNISKFVAGISSVFHLVSLGAHVISQCAEARRGQKVLLTALGGLSILLEYVLDCTTEVMMPSRGVHDIDIEFMFDVVRQTVCTVDKAETQLLRGRGSQVLNAEDVKQVENKLGELRHMAVTAGNTSWICRVDEKLRHLEKQLNICDDEVYHVRPTLSAFFSGRKSELSTLKDMLEEWGSAVIAQYGGVGKTELMIAFADRAEREKAVPGGIFWVTVDGGERDVIESLAGLAEKLTRRKMDKQERRSPNLVVAALKRGLTEREGRWLLCLDNADDSGVSGLLNEVCGIAARAQGNGWVVVTSRQGQPHVWSRMKSEQKLVLEPLCEEDAMVVLWRQIHKIETDERNDEVVMKAIEKLERDETDEYRALKELCGDDGACSLAGLPLALVQAGTYIAQFKCSFAEYLNMFKNANRIEDMQHIMKNTEDVKQIRDSQRSIWTTWKISVEKLSEPAYAVLRAMSMLGPCGIAEAIVKGIVRGVTAEEGVSVDWMFRKVVIEELVHGSSLICQDEGEIEVQGKCSYSMHRLVRRFVVSDMERGSVMWHDLYSFALVSVHEAVEAELGKEGKSFENLPVVIRKNHGDIGAHASALLECHTLPAEGSEIQNVSELQDIHRYSGKTMEFMGKIEEEVQLWERLVTILDHRKEANRKKSGNGRFVDMGLAIHSTDKPHPDIATAFNKLGNAYLRLGQLEVALEKHQKSLEMRLMIHGPSTPHPDIAKSLTDLGRVYRDMGKLERALEKHKEGLDMKLAIYGSNKPHASISGSLSSLANVYLALGNVDKAVELHEKSLEMKVAIYGHNTPHPSTATALSTLGLLYGYLGQLDEALMKHEKSLEMVLAIHGPNKPHPDVAQSLTNLGKVYQKMGKLDEALEKQKESVVMFRAIHGPNKPHPDTTIALSNLGDVYTDYSKLDKALEVHEQSLKMKIAIYGPNQFHPLIATSLSDLGNVYTKQGKLDKALEKHKQGLDMKLAIFGRNKPHPDTATSLSNIGRVYHKQKNLDQAAKFLEQSLAMLRTVYAGNSQHPHVVEQVSFLADVYEDQGRKDDATAIREQCTETNKTRDSEASNLASPN